MIESTPQVVVDAMLVRAELAPEDIVYDLGCGDGRVLKTAYNRWGAKGVGIEIDKEVYAIARRKCKGLPIRILYGDARKYVLHNATVVFMYLERDLMAELVPKCMGARLIVSYSHPIPGLRNRCYWVEDKYPFYVASPIDLPHGLDTQQPSPRGIVWKEFRRTQ